jgi:hypothetical protein
MIKYTKNIIASNERIRLNPPRINENRDNIDTVTLLGSEV